MDDKQLTPEPLMKMATAHWATKVLAVATELEVFTKLSEGPVGLNEMANTLGLQARPAKMLLNACVSIGLMEKAGDKYGNSALSGAFLVKGKPTYLGDLIVMHGGRLYDSWGMLKKSIQTNAPTSDMFDTLSKDSEAAKHFTRAMHNSSMGPAGFIAQNFDFSNCKKFLDIGGGSGAFSIMIAKNNPGLNAIVFDFPPVCEVAQEYIDTFGISSQVTTMPGDLMKDGFPDDCDVVFLSHVLHGFDPNDCMSILEKIYKALPENGQLMINDFILDESGTGPVFPVLFSVNMLLETPSGSSYSQKEISDWLQNIGYRGIEVRDIPGPSTVIVAIK